MNEVRLTNGELLEININFLTIKILNDAGIKKIDKLMKSKSDRAQFDALGYITYAILRSNGKKVDLEEALALVPLDADAIYTLISEFSQKMKAFQKKTSSSKIRNQMI